MMLSFKKIDEKNFENSQNKKIERELPYFITIVTLLATSGLGPYTIFQKIRDINLLPTIRAESIKILKRIDMLGIDPLTALGQAKDRPSSKALGEFLNGYVSSIQSGGNVTNYLKSKMYSTFERLKNREKSSVEKLSGLMHAYLTSQIVILAVFILVASIGATPIEGYLSNPNQANSNPPYVILVAPPIMSVFFIMIAGKMTYSNIREIPIKKILPYAVPPVIGAAIVILVGLFPHSEMNAYILGIALIVASLWPTIKFRKIYTKNMDAETAVPQILRDITEARKAGIGPEKCIAHTCKRTDYKTFTPIANSIANKLEWGIPINNIYDAIKNEINNFQVLISFRILFEVIFSGGGNVNTLDTLADTSERIYNIEKNKRDMLKPYVMVGFMIVAITGFTTLLTIDSFNDIDEGKKIGQTTSPESLETQTFMELIAISVIVQAWLAGLFIGKITMGAYSGGFFYCILFTLITIISLLVVQLHIVNIGAILKTPTPLG
jgi:archaeal flagellar protein FlaJ